MTLSPTEKRKLLQKLHDAAGIGDVEAVNKIFTRHQDDLGGGDAGVNVYRKGGNTALHTALYHSQEGMLIDYLIERGANVNGLNSKGYSPLLVAAIRCKDGNAIKKLIDAGADIDTALEKAKQENIKNAINTLTKIKEQYSCKEIKPSKNDRGDYATCPICNVLVRYPTRMSRIVGFQEEIDKKMMMQQPNDDEPSKEEKGKKKKVVFTSRKYLDQLLSHSEGRAFQKLCNIEYHGVENMKIRKEISESFAILHAVQTVQEYSTALSANNTNNPTISQLNNDNNNDINLQNIFLVDLCSGKGITTALCGALFPQNDKNDGNNNAFLAIDKLLPEQVPHFLHDKHINYLSRDIMGEDMFTELQEMVHHQTNVEGRTAILVGMHLCGMLSEKAIEFFERIPEIQGVVLSPCCLPNKFDLFHLTKFKKDKEGDSYDSWCKHLEDMVGGCNDVGHLRHYLDEDMHTTKNRIIVGVRKK